MPKSNVIPMAPKPEKSLDGEILRYADQIGALFHELAAEALRRIRENEAASLKRLNEYVPTDRLLNIEEAAAYLGFKPRTLRSWCNGTHTVLQFAMIGGELRFKKAWLDAAIERRSVQPERVKL